MKRSKRFFLLVTAILAVLLATGAAAPPPRVTHFEGIAYVCSMDLPYVERTEGDVVHQRGLILREQIDSDEPRIKGVNIDLAHQDLDANTGAVLKGWGTGTLITDAGTWYTSWTAVPDENGLLSSRAFAYGADGLEGFVFYWEGHQLAIPDPPEGCLPIGLELTGFIRRGPPLKMPGSGVEF